MSTLLYFFSNPFEYFPMILCLLILCFPFRVRLRHPHGYPLQERTYTAVVRIERTRPVLSYPDQTSGGMSLEHIGVWIVVWIIRQHLQHLLECGYVQGPFLEINRFQTFKPQHLSGFVWGCDFPFELLGDPYNFLNKIDIGCQLSAPNKNIIF